MVGLFFFFSENPSLNIENWIQEIKNGEKFKKFNEYFMEEKNWAGKEVLNCSKEEKQKKYANEGTLMGE